MKLDGTDHVRERKVWSAFGFSFESPEDGGSGGVSTGESGVRLVGRGKLGAGAGRGESGGRGVRTRSGDPGSGGDGGEVCLASARAKADATLWSRRKGRSSG